MRTEHSDDYRKIRFTRLTFILQFTEETELVRDKTSALRGGIGEMLLREHCIADRNCSACGFREECLVQRMMYSHFPVLPRSVHAGDSAGYILLCEDQRRYFCAGDTMEFRLTLFGNEIVYFSLWLDAVYRLGQNGLGRMQSRYHIREVKNLFGQPILSGNQVYIGQYRWQTLGDYVAFRKEKMRNLLTAAAFRSQAGKEGGTTAFDGQADTAENIASGLLSGKTDNMNSSREAGEGHVVSGRLRFDTPLCLKYRGSFLQDFEAEAIRAGILRRLWILAHFENMPCESMEEYAPEEEFPQLAGLYCETREISRYSSHRDSHMILRGICGEIAFSGLSESWLNLLLAGEVTYIGKNTSFGFGKYRVQLQGDGQSPAGEARRM